MSILNTDDCTHIFSKLRKRSDNEGNLLKRKRKWPLGTKIRTLADIAKAHGHEVDSIDYTGIIRTRRQTNYNFS
jgi:hypothetical protein